MKRKLDGGEIHILKLINREKGKSGWAPVSDMVMGIINSLPESLVEFECFEDKSGRVRLTEEGRNILSALEWINV